MYCVTINVWFKKGNGNLEELKQMLKAIHEENKDILTLLCFNDGVEDQTDENFKEIADEIDERYDALFYGKEINKSENEQ